MSEESAKQQDSEDGVLTDEGGEPDIGEDEGVAADEVAEEAATDGPTAEADDSAELQTEYDALNDRHLRLVAEFTNYRRRQENELTEAWGRAQADLVRRFLDVLDDLQRVSALELADDSVTVESIVEGIDLVERKFVRALEEAGAEPIEPAEGEAFDPERMEAVMRVADETGERDDRVAQLFQKGYLFKGNLVRPARVSVYKA